MSTLNVSNITDGTTTVGTSYVVNGSAKAWVNFNQSSSVGINHSFNVSSWTDGSTGRATTNLTNAMAASEQPCSASATTLSSGSANYSNGAYMDDASAIKFERESASGSAHDTNNVSVLANGDLA